MSTALASDPAKDLARYQAQKFRDCWGRIEEGLRRSAVCNWAIGVQLSEIQKEKLWRFDDSVTAETFDDWVSTRLMWSAASAYRLIKIAREYDQKAIEAHPNLAASHLLAVAKETAELPEPERKKAREKALDELAANPAPTEADAAAAGKAAAGGAVRVEPPARVDLPTVWLEGEVPAEIPCIYVDPVRGNREVKRVPLDPDGNPILVGLRLWIELRPDYRIEVDIQRKPAARLAPR